MHELQEIIAIIPSEEYEGYIGQVREVTPDLNDIAKDITNVINYLCPSEYSGG